MPVPSLSTPSLPTPPIPAAALTVVQAKAAYAPIMGRYLAACTLGLPTIGTVTALREDGERWARGEACPAGYAADIAAARRSYAALVGVPAGAVAIGSQASVLAAMVAASVPDGAEVLCVDGDFSSMVFPFLQQAHRGVRVRHAALDDLAGMVTADTWLVAFSLVQSATGRLADADGITRAARAHGTFTLCDTTQAAGWMPVAAGDFDATICHAYKWLGAPRGAAFLTVLPEFAARLRPSQAGWYAGEDPWQSCYGPEMALAEDARRFDVSPAWPAWVGAREALAFVASLDLEQVRRHDAGLGDALCRGLGIPANGQAIVTWADADGSDLAGLAAAGITASGRAGRARVAFHLWNDLGDVDAVLAALRR
ncbi:MULTISPECIES: aminotransferase class V-fold PLP-dependent enzyme [Cryobacterium]|uniref:Aminotransferase class V-fold PLP-dependent enzyme n=1 Tax=Cryobacterium mannosilyticum TaxID=1259190 RepID=A0A4R8WER4_9MICO|nr:aminotransferase class V-fold PLP-dependent enzyme [Cryobacterium sp. HLT2-28]TFC08016.1 aminotransferase class V-fold PLP-dependent enzyme [Cryobacterium mannosilyticum]